MNKIINEDIEKIIDSREYWDAFNDSVVLVTGASGMIATYLVRVLAVLNEKKDSNITILALGRNEEKIKNKFSDIYQNKYFRFIKQDVTVPIAITEKVDYIFHAASSADPNSMINYPVDIAKANLIGTINVLELARKLNVKQVHFLSTREVYGKQNKNINTVSEDDFGSLRPTDLRAAYPESKRAAENLLVDYYNQYGVVFSISRIAHSYGPGMNIKKDGRIMSDLIGNAVNKKEILLKSKGNAKRAFIYLTDTVLGIFDIVIKGTPNNVYNLANETEEISIVNLAQTIVDLFPMRSKKVLFDIPKETPKGYLNFKRVALNTAKLESLGWKPTVSLKEGISRTVNSYILDDEDVLND